MKAERFQIYIGHNDQDEKVQVHSADQFRKIVKNVCRGYKVAFSVGFINGGYFHEDGTYVEEDSDVLTLLGVTEDEAREIAKDLCAFLNQESVMLVKDMVEYDFVSERI